LMIALFPHRLVRLNRKDLVAGSILGITMFLAFSFHTAGLQYTLGGKAAFLTSINVVVVPLLLWILQKKFPGPDSFISSLICILGTALLTGLGGSNFNRGDLLILFSTLFFAGNIITMGYFAKRIDPISMTLVETGVGAGLFLLSALFTEPLPSSIDPRSLLPLAYMIVLGTVVTHLLSNYALRFTLETHASIIFSLESVFALFIGVVFIKEEFSGIMLLGCGLIFLSLLVTELEPIKRLREKRRAEPPQAL